MNAVMKSVTPKICEKIASGECTILLSKTKLKFDAPFKCYIYCTKGKESDLVCFGAYSPLCGNGRIIGEFVCNKFAFKPMKTTAQNILQMFLTRT